MKLIELTTDNVFNYIGYNVLYKTRHSINLNKINSVSESGENIYIDNEDLNNCLEIIYRKVYVVITNE
jgi:hypothetical protein